MLRSVLRCVVRSRERRWAKTLATPTRATANGDEAPNVNFFRDEVYQNAAASGKPVPWDIRTAQPALVRCCCTLHIPWAALRQL